MTLMVASLWVGCQGRDWGIAVGIAFSSRMKLLTWELEGRIKQCAPTRGEQEAYCLVLKQLVKQPPPAPQVFYDRENLRAQGRAHFLLPSLWVTGDWLAFVTISNWVKLPWTISPSCLHFPTTGLPVTHLQMHKPLDKPPDGMLLEVIILKIPLPSPFSLFTHPVSFSSIMGFSLREEYNSRRCYNMASVLAIFSFPLQCSDFHFTKDFPTSVRHAQSSNYGCRKITR